MFTVFFLFVSMAEVGAGVGRGVEPVWPRVHGAQGLSGLWGPGGTRGSHEDMPGDMPGELGHA